MIEIVVDKIVGPLIGMLSGYFNLPEYGRVFYERHRGKILEYCQEEQFWKDAIGEYFYQPSQRKLFQGNLVKLVDFEITEWFPRCPGLYWTKTGQEYRKSAVEDLINKFGYRVYSPRGKSRMILGGLGTIRLKEHMDKENYKVLCATSSGNCDAGIPLVVSKGVYDEIANEINNEGSIKADVEGFYSQLPINWEDLVIETPGLEISKIVKSWIAASYYVPRYCLQIGSRLQIKKRKSESMVQATAWTLYGCNYSNPLPYSFTFHSFNPKDGNSIKEAAEFIQEYVEEFGGRGILTEFDEVISRFPSIYPLSKVMQSKVDQSIEQKFIMDRAKGLEIA